MLPEQPRAWRVHTQPLPLRGHVTGPQGDSRVLFARPRTPPRRVGGARPPPLPDEHSCVSETGRHAGQQSGYQLRSARPQSPEPQQAASGDTVTRNAPRPRLWPHEASFLVVSGPRVPPWVIAADILFCLGPCPAPSTGDIVRLSLTQAGPDQQDFDLPSTPRGGHDSQPHFYQGQGALGQEPGAKRLLASPKGAQRELDLSPLTLTPRMPRPEEGQERE